jgi:hypothetical protein
MPVAQVPDIEPLATKDFDDAIRSEVARARKTLKNARSAWVETREVRLGTTRSIVENRMPKNGTFLVADQISPRAARIRARAAEPDKHKDGKC